MTLLFRALTVSLVLVAAGCGGTAEPGLADRGIGGTGIAVTDRGIGGTGIVGTVTAFGSVWVNGLRVALPPTTAVRIEGRTADADAVRIGHMVAMTAAPTGSTGLTAQTIDVRFAVAGPVEEADGSGGIVMGQRIDTASAEQRHTLSPGAWVAVSGLRRPDGRIDASRVDAWEPAQGWLLRGRIDAITPTTLVVAGRTLWRDRNLDRPLPAVGTMVRVAGSAAGEPSALSVAPDPFNPFGTTVGALSVETYVDGGGQTQAQDPSVATSGDDAASTRVVIDSVVTPGGGLGHSQAYNAPGLGGRAVPGTDPAARAASLARRGNPAGGSPGPDAPGPGMHGPPGGEGAPMDGHAWDSRTNTPGNGERREGAAAPPAGTPPSGATPSDSPGRAAESNPAGPAQGSLPDGAAGTPPGAAPGGSFGRDGGARDSRGGPPGGSRGGGRPGGGPGGPDGPGSGPGPGPGGPPGIGRP